MTNHTSFDKLRRLMTTVGGLLLLAAPALAQQSDSMADSDPARATEPTFWAVSVADLDAVTQWYTTILGLTPVRNVESRDGLARALILRNGPLIVELIERSGSVGRHTILDGDAHPFDVQGLVKVGLYVADARALHARLAALGVELDRQVMHDETLDLLTFVMRDPEGNRIQVFQEL